MSELILQFDQLNESARQDLLEYLQKLLAKRENRKKSFDFEAYKKSILSISVWSEDELAAFQDARASINNWEINQW